MSTLPAMAHRCARPVFPTTRYQGSKRRLARRIVEHLPLSDVTKVLDAFGGTGAVAHTLKCAGKHVTYNDCLRFNHQIGVALIENDAVKLTEADVAFLLTAHDGAGYPSFIEGTFDGIYFTREENRWLDIVQANIRRLDDRFKRAIAWFAVFQAALAKRPYNLFHRRNLYMRHADVTRTFGNKKTWDRPFDQHFRKYVRQVNAALVHAGGTCRAICRDVFDVAGAFDLVYIDTPYITANGVGVDYRDFYHFLEGMMRYDEWGTLIDRESRHLRLCRKHDPWSDAKSCHAMFERLFVRFRKSILAVSYRSDGIPSIDELATLLRRVKRNVDIVEGETYQYALSKNRKSREVLLIAQ